MKKFVSISLALLLALSITTSAIASTTNVAINGEYVQLALAPVVENGVTLLPVRFVAEAIGADVEWNAETLEVTIKNSETTIVLTLGSNEMVITEDGETKTINLEVAPLIINDRTFLPIDAIAEAFGVTVDSGEAEITPEVEAPAAEIPVVEAPKVEVPSTPSLGDIANVLEYYNDLLEMQIEVTNGLNASVDLSNIMERMSALEEISKLILATDYQNIESMRVKAKGLADIAKRFNINVDKFSHLL